MFSPHTSGGLNGGDGGKMAKRSLARFRSGSCCQERRLGFSDFSLAMLGPMKRSLPIVVGVTLVVSLSAPTNSHVSAASVNGSCKKAGTMAGTTKKPLVCKKVGKKLIWKAVTITGAPKTTSSVSIAPATTTAPVVTTVAPVATPSTASTSAPASLNETASQSNARKKAASYLKSQSFSRSGLIDQLEYSGFNNSDAVYGTDAQNADWKAQAAKKAASYLKSQSFSRSGLIDQLEYSGFTQAEAEYGVGTTGL